MSRRAAFVTIAIVSRAAAIPAQQVDYRRAEQMLDWHASRMVAGDSVEPQWMPDGNRFWYRNKISAGAEYVMVDPVATVRRLVFDNARLASAMSLARDTSYDPVKLPFSRFRFVEGERTIEFNANKKRFHCDLAAYTCVVLDTLPDERAFVLSPDSTWEAFAFQYNLWIRPRGGGDSIQLTTDGQRYWSYGVTEPRPQQLLRRDSLPPPRPQVRWSPDAKRLVVARTDERHVDHMPYISYTAQRPRYFSQPYALPGDTAVPLPGLHVLTLPANLTADGGTGSHTGKRTVPAANVRVEFPVRPNQVQLGGGADSTWNQASDRAYVTFLTRASKALYLLEVDAATGASRVLAMDSARTFVELSPRDPPSWYVTEDGNDVIWWSERDGFAHLYRLDRNGSLKNRITAGPWAVGAVRHVDETAKQIYFTARGREPGRLVYYAHLYRVGFDGSGLTLLTPEEADHRIEFSPSGRFFVDIASTIDRPPVTSLRAAPDGRVVRKLEEADVSRLAAIGWTPPVVFQVKARDGITDIYGVMFKPSDFDSTRTYPVLDHIYPGPQVGSVGPWNWTTGGEERALAELGFIVVEIDHLGTPLRSKAFHDHYYGNFIDNGIPDHIAALKQLGARYRWLDLDRVGIYGHSGGGFASTDAILRFGDFYKVAVSGAGNHDNRSYNIYWAEKYQGMLQRDTVRRTDNFASSANKTYARNLKGKLLLMHGDMDDNVHPAMTIQLVDELIKANRDFDLIVAPDRGHSLNEPYFIRRRWDYFVRHLLGKEPPENYEITRPRN
ncbi:MAG TPA: DPP IV N-terminal domain-containing protein [Gemmatimonadales bacterium]|nr:DPP IV N-terminal domain-containing protein [Gemmatimonadales bacterium]